MMKTIPRPTAGNVSPPVTPSSASPSLGCNPTALGSLGIGVHLTRGRPHRRPTTLTVGSGACAA